MNIWVLETPWEPECLEVVTTKMLFFPVPSSLWKFLQNLSTVQASLRQAHQLEIKIQESSCTTRTDGQGTLRVVCSFWKKGIPAGNTHNSWTLLLVSLGMLLCPGRFNDLPVNLQLSGSSAIVLLLLGRSKQKGLWAFIEENFPAKYLIILSFYELELVVSGPALHLEVAG